MKLTKTPTGGTLVRYTLAIANGDTELTDSVIEARRWLDKQKPDTTASRVNLANCLRSMREHLRVRLATLEVENV